MALEQKFSAIIEAQCKGGAWLKWEWVIPKKDTPFTMWNLHEITVLVWASMWAHPRSFKILEILLDPQGLKAAYGESKVQLEIYKSESSFWREEEQNIIAAHKILDSWLSFGAEGAINTAYNLLPKI